MVTLALARQRAAELAASGDVPAALRIYDAMLTAAPLDYRTRFKIGDLLAALSLTSEAIAVYRAAGHFCLRAGHPLSAIVAARVITENFGGESDDLLASLVVHYGSESDVTGPFAARLSLPGENLEVDLANSESPPAEIAARAANAAADFDNFPKVLHPIPLLSQLTEAAFRRVLPHLVVRRLPAGMAVIREGEPGQSFFFVADGEAVVFDTDSMGSQRELAVLGSGAIFGEMALLSSKPRSASVVTRSEVDLLEASRDSLVALADELPAIAAALQRFTYDRMLENLMAHSPLFRPFTRAQRRDLLRRFTSHDVTAGTPIIHQGDPGTGLFVVLSGAVEVVRSGDGGAAVPLATLRSGDVFGEMSLLGQERTTATVTATEPGTVLFLAKDYVDRIVANFPAVRDYLAALAEDREVDAQLALADDDWEDSVVILF